MEENLAVSSVEVSSNKRPVDYLRRDDWAIYKEFCVGEVAYHTFLTRGWKLLVHEARTAVLLVPVTLLRLHLCKILARIIRWRMNLCLRRSSIQLKNTPE